MRTMGQTGGRTEPRREVSALPKAHLHLHFTGSMRHGTLLELADRDGIVLPDPLVEDWPPQLSAADEKCWFRFQRVYDVVRCVLRSPGVVLRLVVVAPGAKTGARPFAVGASGSASELANASSV